MNRSAEVGQEGLSQQCGAEALKAKCEAGEPKKTTKRNKRSNQKGILLLYSASSAVLPKC